MKKVVVIHSCFDDLGGAETYCLRVLALLQARFDELILVHASHSLDFAQIEKWCGIRLDPQKIRSESVPLPRWLGRLLGGRFSLLLLRYAFVLRRARKLVRGANLVVATFAECPIVARPLLQTIHAPMFAVDQKSVDYLGTAYRGSRWTFHVVYVYAVRLLSGWNRQRIGHHLTITNSRWTAAQFRRHYPARDVRPLYFGVAVSLTSQSKEWLPFSQRENCFVILGRVVPAKRIEEAIAIVGRLRELGHELGLRIVGTRTEPYASAIQQAFPLPWVHWHTDLARDQLEALVAKQKWGLHCFRHEHYGFAPAELQALGCIPFVHDSGGQTEIIRNPAQRYMDLEDAVKKIDAVLRAPEIHEKLLADGTISAAEHTVAGFEQKFLALVDEVST